MTQVPDTIMRRIKKCLALTSSSNEHESAAALRQAQKLMAEYGVTTEGLAASEVTAETAKGTAWREPPAWEGRLAALIAEAFACKVVLMKGHTGVLCSWEYIGLSHQAQLACYAHQVLQRQIVNSRAKYLTQREDLMSRREKMDAGETFCRSFVAELGSKVRALAITPEQKAAVESKLQVLHPALSQYRAPSRGYDASASAAGARAGRDASLHRPMNGGAAQPLLR